MANVLFSVEFAWWKGGPSTPSSALICIPLAEAGAVTTALRDDEHVVREDLRLVDEVPSDALTLKGEFLQRGRELGSGPRDLGPL